ncbi:hypothetical protein JRO89_XS15G0045500 [Xanthoceras sorbifolium]|uniref:Retrotransposon gag domain-containing protein n=1 Tax=Xanthoceras sorbifolium TaxID=99658 RepID=A0ABQ8H108_9ROSI|nr:hypothetical protein JRO89_XS15G0045500 [Xanthoceras sorbifolium]
MNQPQTGPSRAVEGVGGNCNAEQGHGMHWQAEGVVFQLSDGRPSERLRSYKDARVEEFFRLEQKSMSVTDYEEKFSELVRLVLFIQEDEEQRCKRELVEAAMKVERNVTAITQGRPDNKRSGLSSSQSGFSQTSRKKSKTKWIGGKGTYRGAAFSQLGLLQHPEVPDLHSQIAVYAKRDI